MYVLDSQDHLYPEDLYKRYGEFVRTGMWSAKTSVVEKLSVQGPSEITISHPEVKMAVDGPGNKISEAVWYDILLPLPAVNTTRDKGDHDRRRRIWNRAFTNEGHYQSPSNQAADLSWYKAL